MGVVKGTEGPFAQGTPAAVVISDRQRYKVDTLSSRLAWLSVSIGLGVSG